jgi:hypothetical protein
LKFGFIIFWHKKIGGKEALKTFAKLTTGGQPNGGITENSLMFWAFMPYWQDGGCQYGCPFPQICEKILHGVA